MTDIATTSMVRGLAARPLDRRDVTPATPEAEQLRNGYLDAAYRRAGIDGASWDVERHLDDANRAAVYAVPEYYAKLYRIDHALNWSGMASLIAPSFVSGMEDAHTMAGIFTRVQGAVERIPVAGSTLARVPGYYAERSARLERRLMIMQREIFADQAVMHEAYLADGMRGIRELHRTGLLDDHARDAWVGIDLARRTGDVDLAATANLELLRREQLQVIEDDYDTIRSASSGRLATFGISNFGRNSIPGVESLARFRPMHVARATGLPMTVSDVSREKVRWDYIEQRVFPRWRELAETQPELVDSMLATDTATRIERQGLRLLGPSVTDIRLAPVRPGIAAAGVATVGALGAAGYALEHRALAGTDPDDVRVATPYDAGKLAIEVGTTAGGLTLGTLLDGPLRSPNLRSIAAVVGVGGACGLAYRGASMLARAQHAGSDTAVDR